MRKRDERWCLIDLSEWGASELKFDEQEGVSHAHNLEKSYPSREQKIAQGLKRKS